MTRGEAIKFLSNTKVFVKNKGKEVQEKLFNIGFKWLSSSSKELKNLDCPFLYLYKDMTLDSGYSVNTFYEHDYKEILAEDILNIKVEHLPKTWEEYSRENKHWSIIPDTYNKYEAHKQLLHLRDYYRNGWKPKDSELRWSIIPINEDFIIENYIHIKRFLSFQSKEIAEEFLTNFKDLIEEAGDLI